jgi:hypothetical protein
MKLVKKFECKSCKTIVEDNGTCSCGANVIVEGNLVSGIIGVTAYDISPKLLQE